MKKIIFHLFETQNPFARDRKSEADARTLATELAEHASKMGFDDCETKTWDYMSGHDSATNREIKSTLDKFQALVHASSRTDEFHVLIPGGNEALDSLVFRKLPVDTGNIFPVYKKEWHMFSEIEARFLPGAARFHLDGNSHFDETNHDKMAGMKLKAQLLSGLVLLLNEAQPSIFKNREINCNFLEHLSRIEPGITSDTLTALQVALEKAVSDWQAKQKTESEKAISDHEIKQQEARSASSLSPRAKNSVFQPAVVAAKPVRQAEQSSAPQPF